LKTPKTSTIFKISRTFLLDTKMGPGNSKKPVVGEREREGECCCKGEKKEESSTRFVCVWIQLALLKGLSFLHPTQIVAVQAFLQLKSYTKRIEAFFVERMKKVFCTM